ncbi:MAG: hypothetical protein ABIP30_10480 [Ferruginibacter sp.]
MAIFSKKYTFFFISMLLACATKAQEILPGITVKNVSGKIIVSWQNQYNIPAANINIQRSYDSLKNFTTIGTVLNPQNKENGYADENPPYNKMYYRLFIAFEGGSYIITKPARPVKENLSAVETDSTKITRYPWQVDPLADSSINVPPTNPNIPVIVKPVITYPSRRVYTSRDNSVVLHLPGASQKKYLIKFFDENDNMIFELTKLKEEYLIVEKVNFGRSGWYHFELYDGAELVEKNRFFVPKDVKVNNK